MGTKDPLVHIEAATLAGGDNNQDRYAYGDGWAFVLDGGSSFSEDAPIHDGGWFAERLKTSLIEQLTRGLTRPTEEVVAEAIAAACSLHDEEEHGPCPTGTIAMARWSEGGMEMYVLGDSSAIWWECGELREFTDDRLDRVAPEIRETYRSRLAAGSGFDEEHKRLLANLQQEQLRKRNTTDGYWIAGNTPMAARHGYFHRMTIKPGFTACLTTDGLDKNFYDAVLSGAPLESVLSENAHIEDSDPDGAKNPRSKLHDDKTVVRMVVAGEGMICND